MRVQSHLISCSIGLFAGALLVAGLAVQPARGPDRGPPNRQPGNRLQGDRPKGDRPAPGPEGPGGPEGLRQPIAPERAIQRLEDRLKGLDKQKELINTILVRLRNGEPTERMGPELIEAMRGSFGPNQPPQGAGGGGGNDREEMRRIVGEFDPALVKRMDDFAKRHPVGGRILGNLMPNPQDMLRAQREDPALFDLYKSQITGGLDAGEIAMNLLDLARAGKEDSDEAKTQKASLREALATQFETRRKVQERDIESLTRRIEELKVRVNENAEQRAAAVEAHLERLTKQLREMKPRAR